MTLDKFLARLAAREGRALTEAERESATAWFQGAAEALEQVRRAREGVGTS